MVAKEKNFIRDTLKKYGFNPMVTTIGSLNQVSLQDSAKLHSEELNYLKNLVKDKKSGGSIAEKLKASRAKRKEKFREAGLGKGAEKVESQQAANRKRIQELIKKRNSQRD